MKLLSVITPLSIYQYVCPKLGLLVVIVIGEDVGYLYSIIPLEYNHLWYDGDRCVESMLLQPQKYKQGEELGYKENLKPFGLGNYEQL